MERVWKEAVMAYFMVLSQHLSRDSEEDHENLIQDSRIPSRDSKFKPPEYKAEMLTIRQPLQMIMT
jgi:hypothetical protein